jgi:hypothetical protein
MKTPRLAKATATLSAAVLLSTLIALPATAAAENPATGPGLAGAAVSAVPEQGVPGPPTIQGDARVGAVLTADTGTWTPEEVTFSYEWLRNDSLIYGATEQNYTPTAADMGATLKVRVTGNGASFNGIQATSEATAAVVEGTQPAPVPVIIGDASVGQALTANPGTWAPGTVFRYQWYRVREAIGGATGNGYRPTPADLNQTLTVSVTGTKDGYSTLTAVSAPTSAVNPTAPRLSGVQVGHMANGYNAAYSWPQGTRFTSAWYRDGVPIPGAYTEDYGVMPADYGHTLTYSVTGTKDGYAPKTVSSAARVQAGVFQYPYVRVSGEARVGETLTATFSASSWYIWGQQRAPETKTTWQWYRSGVAIAGAGNSTYTLTAEDLGKNIYVRATASRTGYTSATGESADLLGRVGTFTASPVISGTKKVGYTLTALPQTPVTGATAKYQWYRSGVAVTGATAAKYTLTAADRGKTLRVRMSLSKNGYEPLTAYSATTAAIVAGTLSAPIPRITGTARYGYTMAVNPGAWTAGTTLRYQWYRSGVAIAGATAKTYRLVAADRYDTLKVRVTGSKAGYATATKFSGSTVRIP